MMTIKTYNKQYYTTPCLYSKGMARCSDCGHLLALDTKICTKCGTSVEIIIESKINSKIK